MNTAAGNNNLDLIWELDYITDKSKAQVFLKNFEEKLCVYSPSVGQLYTRYEIISPVLKNDSLVVHPSYQDITASYSHINNDAILPTNVFIVSGEVLNKEGLFMVIKPQGGTKGLKAVPLMEGLKKIQSVFCSDDPFLPVMVKGGLRELSKNIPCLNISRIKLSALRQSSKLECNSIRTNIFEKLGLLDADTSSTSSLAAF
jgi:hypothetical protein